MITGQIKSPTYICSTFMSWLIIRKLRKKVYKYSNLARNLNLYWEPFDLGNSFIERWIKIVQKMNLWFATNPSYYQGGIFHRQHKIFRVHAKTLSQYGWRKILLNPKSYFFRELKQDAKFKNPRKTPSGRKVTRGDERERKEKTHL